MAAKKNTKAKAGKKPAVKKTAAKKAAPKAKAPKLKAAGKNKGPAKAVAKAEKTEKLDAAAKRKAKANAALEAALGKSAGSDSEEDEFDPEAFFAASGGQGVFRAHVMRKERVDLNIIIRFRNLDSPLVTNAELVNLSKGGLCLKTPKKIKNKTVLRIEIPLPHTSELFAVQAEVIWSTTVGPENKKDNPIHTGLRFMPMSLAKQTVINNFVQQRRDQLIMQKIGLENFSSSAPVAGLD